MLLCPDDIVSYKGDPSQLAVVERTHQDVDTHEPNLSETEPMDIMADGVDVVAVRRFVQTGIPPKGTVYVRPTSLANGLLIVESKLELVDRCFLMGDVVQKDGNMSGVVINTVTECELRPMATVNYKETHTLRGLLPPMELNPLLKKGATPEPILNVPASELMDADSPSDEDLIIYKDWIGRLDAVHHKLILMLADRCVVEIADEFAEHADGAVDYFAPGDIALTKKGVLRHGKWIFGSYNANTPPAGTVVQTRIVAVEVEWLERRIGSPDENEPPYTLEREDLDSAHFRLYDRTRKPTSQITGESCGTVSNSEMDIRLGSRVRFKDLTDACMKYDGSTSRGKLSKIDRTDTLGYDLNVFDVSRFHTTVTVQWQDLSITENDSTSLIPDNSIDDEHVAWPGEVAHTLDLVPVPGSDEKRPSKIGVIQTIKPDERMARIQWCPEGFVHRGATDDDQTATLTAIVGVSSGIVDEVSLYDLATPASLNVRRGDIVLISNKTWVDSHAMPSAGDLDWVGEIVDTRLDGRLTVRLGIAAEVEDVTVNREHVVVAVRSDNTFDGGFGEDGDSDEEMLDGPEVSLDGSGTLGVWHGGPNSDDATDDMEEEEIQASYEDEYGQQLDEDDVEGDDWESADGDADGDAEMLEQSALPPQTTLLPTSARTNEPNTDTATAASATSLTAPESYVVLDTPVPQSHHYHSTTPTPSPAHLKRTAKEHKILRTASNLPPGVFVRTWESRLDLLRVLLIGPSDTPYSSAPFVFDFHLSPRFPHEPPEAFFHSWSGEPGLGGVGRVNPNLYEEDGKICLSLLGTWEGNKGEGWSATKSTLLQLIVSLLGLVLVKEPYYNEAGYEHLKGLDSTRRPSALYSERTFLRARTFVITALSRLRSPVEGQKTGIEGFEDVLRTLYSEAGGPRLMDQVIKDVEDVLRQSEGDKREIDGLHIMSKGACIPLRRVLERLRQLQ